MGINKAMSHLMPTDQEIRDHIEAIPKRAYQLAFKYQYLIAGRISEVCGKYAPRGIDASLIDFDGEGAVLFVVRTAKRRGRLRPAALPLKYEAWSREVYDYFTEFGNDYPFKFAERWGTSVRYMQWEAENAFKGLEWPMVEYTAKVGDVAIKIPPRWKNVTSHVMRKRRALTLLYDYDFDGVDLGIYGGWTLSSQAEEMPPALKSYLHLDPSASRESTKLMKKMAKRYFPKLCKPYEG